MLRPCLIATLLITLWHVSAPAETPPLLTPRIAGYGPVVALDTAAEPPRSAAKIVFDITADAPVDQTHRGLEAAARYFNLHALAGHSPDQLQIAIVLHGAATKIALSDPAYARVTSAQRNPNLELVRQLKACGAEVFVCGQSLARHQFDLHDVDEQFAVAVSAMTVNANRQADGYSYLFIP